MSSLVVRTIYCVLIGWRLSFTWAPLNSFFAVTIVGLPIAIWLINRLPFVASLSRFDE